MIVPLRILRRIRNISEHLYGKLKQTFKLNIPFSTMAKYVR
jgi:hypothetical protein